MSPQDLGNPLSSLYSIPGGQAHMYERGLVVDGSGGEVALSFAFPMIGRPSIVTGDPAVSPSSEFKAFSFSPGNWQVEQLTPLVQKAIDGRLALVPTGRSEGHVPLLLGSEAQPERFLPSYSLSVKAPGLQERQLYDVAVLTDAGAWQVIAPHAVYHRKTWTDFGIASINDIHVARRIDGFRQKLVQAGRDKGARHMINWNDRFRAFVKYANHSHSIGVLDIILAIGDVYDYIYEVDDDPAGGGNAEFLRRLILGQAPGPDFPDVEELLVPIFMVPGNHDYRKYAYKLIFDLEVLTFDARRIRQYSGFNLTGHDAAVVTIGGELPGTFEDMALNISPDEAARAVELDRDLKAYKTFLAHQLSYVVRLGDHRIVMLDSGPDTGIVTSEWEWIKDYIGADKFTEDEASFIDSNPSSQGISDGDLNLASEALSTPPDRGLVIVGVHAPLFNLVGNDYPYFLRETQRRTQSDQPAGFLARQSLGVPYISNATPEAMVKAVHPLWFPGKHDNRRPTYVKRGDSQDMLDFGGSRRNADDLMRLLAGVGSSRPADLVLSGHCHEYNEFKVRLMPSGELVYFMDFYTENPERYYSTRFTKSWTTKDLPGGLTLMAPITDVTYVRIVPGAAADAKPSPLPENDTRKYKYQLEIPPYPNPLSSTNDPRAWWAEHRPLVLQTGALGPLKHQPVSFEGFRMLLVKNDVIDKINFISVEELETIRPSNAEVGSNDLTEVSGAPSAVGDPAAYVFDGSSQHVIYRAGDGHLYELYWTTGAVGRSDLTKASGAPAAVGDPATYVLDSGQHVIYRTGNGHLYELYWTTGAVGQNDLTRASGAPSAAGDPTAYVLDGSQHVIYRAGDGHLYELYWTTGAVGQSDLTKASGAPAAVGDPTAYVLDGSQHVIYRTGNGHLYELYWTTGAVGQNDLTKSSGAPAAAGDPTAYVLDGSQHVIYRAGDGHLYELYWTTGAVGQNDLTKASGAPSAAGNPAAYILDDSQHVIYRDGNGHLHELWWTTGAVGRGDLTRASGAPTAAGDPAAYVFDGSQHVIYRDGNSHLHELWWG